MSVCGLLLAPLQICMPSDGVSRGFRSAFAGYVAPIITFGLFTALEQFLPQSMYPFAYFVKITAVSLSLLIFKGPIRDIRPAWSVLAPSVVVGLLVFAAWVGIDMMVPYPHLGNRVGFNPNELQTQLGRVAFLAIRFYGLVLVVPVMEELLWRSFLLRYVTNEDFLSVPIGVFSLSAFGVMVALSAAAHPEWLAAIVASAAYGLWVRHTRSLFAAIVAHSVTNCALGVYVVVTHSWKYW